jgi:integrase/recombinase XerD
MRVSAEQVKLLVDCARTPRDRALILLAFQSGMDASTMCSLLYSDIKEGLKKGEHPLKIEPQRPKTGVSFYTFLGRDGIEALKAYLNDARFRGISFSYDSPLFVTERGRDALEPHNVESMIRNVAVRSGLVDEHMSGRAFNPLGIHALRESFGSIMTNSGVPDTIVDFWLGHSIGEMAEAYKSIQFESVRKMFLEREKLLSTSQSSIDNGEAKQLQKLVNALTTENLELKSKLARLEQESAEKRSQNLIAMQN